MKDDVLEMFRDGMSIQEIVDATGLSHGTVGTYIYSSGIQHEVGVQEVQLRAKIRRLVEQYEARFGPLNS